MGENMWKRMAAQTLVAGLIVSSFTGITVPQVSAATDPVNVWMTTGDKSNLLSRQKDVSFDTDGAPSELTIDVDENTAYQTIDGFGGALTDSSAYVISKMEPTAKDQLMKKLFSREGDGAGFSYLRLPMGASDFATSKYTYDDMPKGETDPELHNFSIEHDEEYIIPLLQQALEINPDLKIMGTPWTAPGWMKTTDAMEKGKLLPEYYGVYAQYFVKFIEDYEEAGIPIDAVTIQNEPQFEPSDYSGMRMEPEDEALFVKDYLGPAFEEAGIDTKIIVFDHNWSTPQYPIDVLNDKDANKYIAGSAFHGYAGSVDAQSLVHDQHPDKDIYFTESSGGEFASDFGGNIAWDYQNLIIGATRNWARTSLKWNIALDENNGPFVGGCSDCRGIVTVVNHEENNVVTSSDVTYNEEFYAFGQASKFVLPGAKRIQSNTFGAGSIEDAAFLNPDGTKVLLALNSSKQSKTFKIRWGAKSFSYTLPAGAIASYVWSGTQVGTVSISPYAVMQAEDFVDNVGVTTDIAGDTGGGKYVGSAANGNYIAFDNVEFQSGTSSIKVRAAAEGDASIQFRLDSPTGALLGTADLTSTGGAQSWITKAVQSEAVSGKHKLYVMFSGKVNLNWFQFSFDSVQSSFNYLALGGGFEEGNTGWNGWNPEGQGYAQNVDNNSPRTGSMKLSHYLGGTESYQQTTYRTVKVPNGTYKASVWYQKGGDTNVSLEAKRYGGPDLSVSAGTTAYVGSWTQIVIPVIEVTDGQVEIGIHSANKGGEWASFDDVELIPVISKASVEEQGDDAPATPQDVTADLQNGQNIHLQWTKAADAIGYKIYRSVVNSDTKKDGVYPDYRLIGSAGDVTSYVDQGLLGSTTYSYRVSAFNASGESAASGSVTATTAAGKDSVAPAAPVGLKAVPGIQQVKLTWEPNLENDFFKYNIYVNGFKRASVDPATESRYTLANLVAGTQYTFTVKAVDQAGNESAASEAVVAAPTVASERVKIPASNNLDFETLDQANKPTLSPWQEWHPGEQSAAPSIDNDTPRSGKYKLTHWNGSAYKQSNFQTINVPVGKYKVQVWVRTGGGQNTFQLEVSNYGGDKLTKDLKSASGGTYTPFAIDNIEVVEKEAGTGLGTMQIGVYSDAKAGNWAAIDDFEIYKYPEATVAVEGVTLDKSALSLNLNGMNTGNLTATINPSNAENHNLYWSSSDTSVAVVADGVVTAKGVGTAQITVTTEDGGYKAETAVVVKSGNVVTPPSTTPTDGTGHVTTNGNVSVISGLMAKTETNSNGKATSIVEVNAALLAQAAQDAKVDSITVDLRDLSDVSEVQAQFPVDALKELLDKNSKLSILVITDQGSYELPLQAILSGTAASGQQLRIGVGTISEEANNAAIQAVNKKNGTLLGTPIEFTVWTGTANNWTEVKGFGKHYVTRTIQLGKTSVPPTTGIVIESDGTIVPVPTTFNTDANGNVTAVIRTNHNSVYAVVASSKTFTDTKGHWAEKEINTLASSFILNGETADTFAPEQQLTRAEWVAMLTRALGLTSGSTASNFKDVSSNAWYADAVAAATEAGIIQGFTDGTFRPNDKITKQQLAVTAANVLAFVGGNQSADVDQLAALKDSSEIAAWAADAVAQSLKSGLIKGTPEGKFYPNKTATRAEAATILYRLITSIQE
ncbi:S-layer-like y domain-containing protein [Paenibacillus lupini]|uniref:S-layer homology domain-containing protein n=1 Tax=Paenibacillus lupini TaxID=1450204 RepID=UPI001FB97E91|nr:S-layer homology domain-containing protein [Paenibacillus lupini]NIK25535.1 glucosylceramidase [Paenibacillus lupini]